MEAAQARVSRQLGCKNVKFIHGMIVTADLKEHPSAGLYPLRHHLKSQFS